MAAALRLAVIAALLLSGCNRRSDDEPVVVSAIGVPPRLLDPSAQPVDAPTRLLLSATAQGLVSFDADGQIAPGLAERWIVIDDGMSYIFRLRRAEWGSGRQVTAEAVVARLKRAVARRSRNPLFPWLRAIDEIVVMTPEVIEIRLRSPRPDLLKLLAQPELAVFETATRRGSGPFRIAEVARNGVTLRPALDADRIGSEDYVEPGPEENVQLIGERAGLAIARFKQLQSDYVAGGTFQNWPLVAAGEIAPANIRLDPAAGLFGLAVVEREGFLATPENRAAVAMAIDRAALAAAFSDDMVPAEWLLPAQLDSAGPPMSPEWTTLSLEQRRASARARVATWRIFNAGPIRLRIALPDGPGGTILFGQLGAALIEVGIEPERVPLGGNAELRLIDAVAPHDTARWYLATACAPCSDEARTAIEAARDATSTADRATRIAEADALLSADSAFIPLARPLRWSLVSLRLRRWTPNVRAVHPLNELRGNTN